jgi:hypothetical protein
MRGQNIPAINNIAATAINNIPAINKIIQQ